MRRKKIINTIMIGGNFFKAANFYLKKGKLYQRAFVEAFLNFAQKETSIKIIKSGCQEGSIDLRREFSAVISRSQVTIKNFELPTMNANEVGRMVDFQLQGSLPYRAEDLIIQNLIYPSSKEGYSQVKAVVIQKEFIDKFMDIFKESAVNISGLDLSSMVLLNRFKMIYKKEPFFEKTGLLINIEGESVDFVFMENGRMLLSRGIFLRKDNFYENFIVETKKSLSLFNHKFPDKGVLVFLWGRKSDLKNLADLIHEQTGLMVQIKEDENLLKSLAYCVYRQENGINLLPQAIKDKQKTSLKRRNFAKIIFTSAVIVIFIIAGLFFDFKEKEKQLAVLNFQIEKIETDAAEIQRKNIIIENVLAKRKQALQSLEMLSELYSLTPSGIFFNSFLLLNAESAIIKGQAEKLNKILEFVSELEQSDFFKNVELKYTSKRRLKAKEVVDFEIAFFVN